MRRDEAIRAALRTTIDTEQREGRISDEQAGLLRAGLELLPIPELVERLAEGARQPG
jgi:Arc/MetJ-type ribon-helix-helix transcriptional regulator